MVKPVSKPFLADDKVFNPVMRAVNWVVLRTNVSESTERSNDALAVILAFK